MVNWFLTVEIETTDFAHEIPFPTGFHLVSLERDHEKIIVVLKAPPGRLSDLIAKIEGPLTLRYGRRPHIRQCSHRAPAECQETLDSNV